MKEQSLYHNYNWNMSISAIPSLNAVTQLTLPSITCTPTTARHSTGIYPLMGEVIEFEQMSCTIQLDEQWNNYFSILDWFYSLRNPGMLKTHKKDADSKANILFAIRGNQGGPNQRIMFFDVKPVGLSQVDLDIKTDETIVTNFNLQFAYSYFKRLNDSELAEGFGVSL